MPITLEVAGTEYTNFTSGEANIALDTLANDFSFEIVSPGEIYLPFKGGESCRVLVDGELVLTGSIEEVDGSYSSGNHIITIAGRDKTGDLIDSSIGVLNNIRGDLTLKQIIEIVIEHIGADISVVDNANPEKFNKAEDIATPAPGTNAFQFIEGYAQKRQVLLTSNAEGNLVITNSSPTKSTGHLQNSIGADGNNVFTASWSYRTSDRFNKYIQLGQQDPSALTFGNAETDDGIIEQIGIALDDGTGGVRKGRQFAVVASVGYSNEQLKNRAEWSKKIRNARSTVYSASPQGFADAKGNLWAINQTVPIIDDLANINRQLLTNTLSFSFGLSGSITTIGFVEKDAYTLKAQEPVPVGDDQDAFKL